ncbi:hypothetical protein ACWPKO_13705 [Coraliomargarita sp. W4R53]
MKFIAIAPLFLVVTLIANGALKEVGYKIGPQLFRKGDNIQILEVWASSSKFELNEIVTVKGTYTLASHSDAKINIVVTQTEGDGKSEISPNQRLEIGEGTGAFELSIEIQHKGYLHVTFYPTDGGRGFGGVYLGAPKQMKEIKDWKLGWYLDDPISEDKPDSIPVIQTR